MTYTKWSSGHDSPVLDAMMREFGDQLDTELPIWVRGDFHIWRDTSMAMRNRIPGDCRDLIDAIIREPQ